MQNNSAGLNLQRRALAHDLEDIRRSRISSRLPRAAPKEASCIENLGDSGSAPFVGCVPGFIGPNY